jgi:hypothetical protein
MCTRRTMLLRVLVTLSTLLLAAWPAQASRQGGAMAGPAAPGSRALDPSQMYVDDDWAGLPPGTPVFFPGDPYSHTIGIDAFAAIQDGLDGLVLTGTVHVADGLYTGTIDIVSRTDVQVVGLDRDMVIVRPAATLCWDVGGYGCGRHTAVRVVDSTGIAFANQTWDWVDVSGNNVSGFLYWDSSGTLEHNLLKNMSRPDAGGYYYELTSYFRAPSYSDTLRAEIVLHDNVFTDTGRLGLVSHDFVHMEIEGNTFAKGVDDFGYAMEIGSRSTAVISGNVIYGFDTPAASDGSVSAGIYVENSFTAGLPHLTKTVTICNNNIHGSQYGLFLGNEFAGYAGDIDIVTTLQGNDIHDNLLGGLYVVDEGRDAGSSVTLDAADNRVTNNGGVGCYVNTYGNGALHVDLAQNTIRGHEAGVLVENWGGAGSLYDLDAHHNRLVDNTWGVSNTSGAAFPAADNWWGCNGGPGDPGCDPVFGTSYDPWLVLGLKVTPTLVLPAGSSDLAADLTWNSVPTDTSPWGHLPDGTPVGFAATLGTAVPTATVTSGGMSWAVFTAGTLPGIAVISTTVDSQTVTGTVAIVAPLVQWSSPLYSVDEAAGDAVVTVTIAPAPAITATVDYAALAGTAMPGEDFVGVSGTLSFAPGQTCLTLLVPVLDDSLDEPDETVFLSLTNPVNAELGTPFTATLTILDNDQPPPVHFDRAAYAAGEGTAQAVITVTLGSLSPVTVTVDYATLAGTAMPGEDYVAVSGTLVFAPGQQVVTFGVPLLDDSLDEPDETVFLSLTNPVNAEPGTPFTATLTLLDDDEEVLLVHFDRAAYAAGEGTAQAVITVTLGRLSPVTVTVDYATLAGTAMPGEDYVAVSGTVAFAPGQQVVTFSVPLLDDSLDEPDETVFLSLTNPVNAELGTPFTATLTLLDDDAAYRLYLPLIYRVGG